MIAVVTHRELDRTWTQEFVGARATDALAQMDGRTVTDLSIGDGGGAQLLVGGGPNRFTVMAALGPDNFFDLVGDPDADGEAGLIVGGQLTPWPMRLCASRIQTLHAVQAWLAEGRPDTTQLWERQGDVTGGGAP